MKKDKSSKRRALRNLRPGEIIRASDYHFGWHPVPREWIGKKAMRRGNHPRVTIFLRTPRR